MTDARLRRAQRRAEAEGSPEARAAVLQDRLRAGEECRRCSGTGSWKVDPCSGPTVLCPGCAGLPLRRRIELAAYCGDEVAKVLLGVESCNGLACSCVPRGNPTPCPMEDSDEFGPWLRGLVRWGQPVLIRAAVAAGRKVMGWRNQMLPEPEAAALGAAEAWLACPCQEHREDFRRVSRAWSPLAVERWAPSVIMLSNAHRGLAAQKCRWAARLTGEAAVRKAISRALIAWALGVDRG